MAIRCPTTSFLRTIRRLQRTIAEQNAFNTLERDQYCALWWVEKAIDTWYASCAAVLRSRALCSYGAIVDDELATLSLVTSTDQPSTTGCWD